MRFMLTDVNVAEYFLAKDKDRWLFNKDLIHKNDRVFYKGAARLDKYLHLAQNIYIEKTGSKLFAEDLYAYDNGAVAPTVHENYDFLLSRTEIPDIAPEIRNFLDKIFKIFGNASLDELIELSHEDQAWTDNQNHGKANQRMNSLSYTFEYQEQYRDILKVIDRLILEGFANISFKRRCLQYLPTLLTLHLLAGSHRSFI